MNGTQHIKGYEIGDRIGAGGFGAVYRATQSTVGREVAIKIVLPGLANQPEFIRRFESEAQIVARLEHPHITPLYDYWRDSDGAYLVMRYLRGGSLRDALQNGAFESRAAALMLDQIAGALSLAHRSGVIHRDIKPGNILLDEDGNAYLTDFGIAKDLHLNSANTGPDAIIGSLDYISPEQARSEPITPRTDIYSLGVTLYETITGQHPFPNINPVERLYKHINDPLPPITTLDPSISAAVNRAIQKATAKNPDDRYADALAFAADFRAAIGMNRVPTDITELLTPREHEILALIIAGDSNKEIAHKLTVTLSTVKWYVNQIYSKLGVRSRVQAMVRARELNLLVIGKSGGAESDPQTIRMATEDFNPINPYKGLLAFQSADYQEFFGRERLTAALIKRIGETGEYARFTAIVGPSGSGKSSLVKAGVIPALWRGDLKGAEKWYIAEMIPGSRPLDELEIALTKVAAQHAGDLHDHLLRDQYGLLRAAGLILPNDGSDLLLVVDQFEEVFTLCEDDEARGHFLDLIHAAVTEPRSRVRVIITLRADYYDRPLHYPHVAELMRHRLETVLPLSAEELERAIVKPAERVGIGFEAGLVSAIVADVKYQPGALPLLQYALTELFDGRSGRMITRETYQTIGGTAGALAKRAEALYTDLPDDQREAARQMFLRLVTLGEGADDTRRRVLRSELMALNTPHPPTPSPTQAGRGGENSALQVPSPSGRRGESSTVEAPLPEGEGFGVRADLMDEVIDTFADYRLLALDNDPMTHAPTVEAAHEALLREWERLRGWINASREEIATEQQLAHLTGEWISASQDASFLISGTRLDQLEYWAQTTNMALMPTERAYLDASIARRQSETAAEAARAAKEQVLERRSVNRLRGLVAVLVVATIGAFLLSLIIGVQANAESAARATSEANYQRSEALRLASDADGLLPGSSDNAEIAALLAIRSLNLEYTTQANDALTDALRLLYGEAIYSRPYERSEARYYSFPRWLPGGLSVLIVTRQDTVELYNLETGTTTVLYNGTEQPTAADFSPDRSLVLAGFADGSARVFDLATGAEQLVLNGQAGAMLNIAMSDDGQVIATTGDDNTVWLWEVASGEPRHTVTLDYTGNGWMDFSPDDRYLAVPKINNTVDVIDVQSGEIVRQMGGGLDWLETAVFSSDGTMLLTASSDGSARLWDSATGELLRSFTGHRAALGSAYFSPDDHFVLTASRDGTARLWDITTGEEVRRFSGHHGGLRYAGFSPDGIQIVTTSPEENTWRVWDARLAAAPDRMIDHDFGGFYSWGARFSLDGRWIITGYATKTGFALYDAETREHVRDIDPEGIYIAPFALSPDGRYVLGVADEDRSNIHMLLIDLETGEVAQTYIGHSDRIMDAAFSPDGQWLITSSLDQTARVWNVASGEQVHMFSHEDGVSAVGFSRDGNSVFTGGYADGVVRQWDVTSGEEIRQFPSSANAIYHIIVPLDGEHVIGGGDAGISAWDINSGETAWEYSGTNYRVDIAALSPDGTALATVGQNGVIYLWDPETGEELRQLFGFDAVPYSLDFSPDGSRLITNGGYDQLQLWYLDWHDLAAQACARIFHDLSPDERAAYEITDANPTCPQFTGMEG